MNYNTISDDKAAADGGIGTMLAWRYLFSANWAKADWGRFGWWKIDSHKRMFQ